MRKQLDLHVHQPPPPRPSAKHSLTPVFNRFSHSTTSHAPPSHTTLYHSQRRHLLHLKAQVVKVTFSGVTGMHNCSHSVEVDQDLLKWSWDRPWTNPY